jgi:hypothetical protein
MPRGGICRMLMRLPVEKGYEENWTFEVQLTVRVSSAICDD